MSYPEKQDNIYPNPYGGGAAPVQTMQPQVGGHTTVVINQQQQRFAKRPWTHGFCDCCGDMGGLLCAWCFPWCYKFTLAEAMGEGCMTCCCASLGAMRTKVRAERGIAGEVWEDDCAAAFCHICVMVQMARELKDTQALI